jgi:hypothetical protein
LSTGPTERDDDAHLTGKGPNFVSKMRELNLIEEGCEGNCLCGPDPYLEEKNTTANKAQNLLRILFFRTAEGY